MAFLEILFRYHKDIKRAIRFWELRLISPDDFIYETCNYPSHGTPMFYTQSVFVMTTCKNHNLLIGKL